MELVRLYFVILSQLLLIVFFYEIFRAINEIEKIRSLERWLNAWSYLLFFNIVVVVFYFFFGATFIEWVASIVVIYLNVKVLNLTRKFLKLYKR